VVVVVLLGVEASCPGVAAVVGEAHAYQGVLVEVVHAFHGRMVVEVHVPRVEVASRAVVAEEVAFNIRVAVVAFHIHEDHHVQEDHDHHDHRGHQEDQEAYQVEEDLEVDMNPWEEEEELALTA
jgi:hypothetical protein